MEKASKNNETAKLGIGDVIGCAPREKWENFKKYILTQIEKIDKETHWENTKPKWWLEIQTNFELGRFDTFPQPELIEAAQFFNH